MNVQTAKFNRPKVLVVALALSALAITLLAVVFASGPAQAQSPSNTYTDPQPCGPGAGTAFQPEPHEITTGHFALFDAYWESPPANPTVDTNYLHTNLCPPKVTTTKKYDPVSRKTTTVTSLSASGIDIHEAIFHVKDEHEATAVATNAQIAAGKISLEEYPELDDFVDAGDTVWWLQLDDPDTTVDETSDLRLGFSTRHLDGKYWYKGENERPLHYRLDARRYPGHPNDHPHFLVYRAPKDENATHTEQEVVWTSARAGVSVLKLEPGVDITDLQWIFTDEGTYEIWVELVAYVRQADNQPDDAPDGWVPISANDTETSEVRRYVIQVGAALDEVEPPMFGVVRSIRENAVAGTAVGAPIRLFGAEVDSISYTLSGEGADRFAIGPTSDRNGAQIVVAEGAQLDYETKAAYDLILSVTDNIDHESNPDDTADHTLALALEVIDGPDLTVSVQGSHAVRLGQTATWLASLEPLPDDATDVTYHWSIQVEGSDSW